VSLIRALRKQHLGEAFKQVKDCKKTGSDEEIELAKPRHGLVSGLRSLLKRLLAVKLF
jgi:hypothetical protein